MYAITALPLDLEVSDEQLISAVRKKIAKSEIYHLPKFEIKNLDSLFKNSDELEILNKKIEDLFENFKKLLKEHCNRDLMYDYKIKTFTWCSKRYDSEYIDDLFEIIQSKFLSFSQSFQQRVDQYDKLNKSIEQKKKEINGNLKDIDLEIGNYEFLTEHLVVVPKSQQNEFLHFVDELQQTGNMVSGCEEVLKDSENILYRMLGIKKYSSELKKMIGERGYIYKTGYCAEEYKKRQEKREIEKDELKNVKSNLTLFLSSNEDEFFSLMMHAKNLKLFVETLLLYGMGNAVFFCLNGKKERVLKEWKKIILDWKFSKRIIKKIDDEEMFPIVFIENDKEDYE